MWPSENSSSVIEIHISHNVRKCTFWHEGSNKSAIPRSLIRVFVVRMKKLSIFGCPKCTLWRFWSDCAIAQADLNLYISKGTFSHVVSHIFPRSAYKYVVGTMGILPASILYKSIAGRYRPVSNPDRPITARYRFIKNAYWGVTDVIQVNTTTY